MARHIHHEIIEGLSGEGGVVRRVRVVFAGRVVEFVDREVAVRQLREIAEKGTWKVFVIYGPEGCGKTALLRQATEILDSHGYAVVHVNPLAETMGEKVSISRELRDLARELGIHFVGGIAEVIDKTIELLYKAIRRGIRRRIAVLLDDVSQAIGIERAEQMVKSLLNMIEWPPVEYEKIVVLVSSSEGVTRERIGRHRWAEILTMWNMARDGFKQLYNLLPQPKPLLEEAWRWTGGNPKMLEELYMADWSIDRVVKTLIAARGLLELLGNLEDHEREVLEKAIEDPDTLQSRKATLVRKLLVERNLVVPLPPFREPYLWVDEPPPEKNPELGIGQYYAWQTPLHREAVRKALEQVP